MKLVIIGAGLSGIAVFVHLVRIVKEYSQGGTKPAPIKVAIVNKANTFAKGLAYGTSSASHLLNVPSGRMSLFSDLPDDFLIYLRSVGLSADSLGFVPRAHFGAYLQQRFLDAKVVLEDLYGAGSVLQISAEAISISSGQDTHGQINFLQLSDGAKLEFDRLVIATGNFSPAWPPAFQKFDHGSSATRLISDPWLWLKGNSVTPNWRSVLLLGTGLTMMDVVSELLARGYEGKITAVSRRGLIPQCHRGHPVASVKVNFSEVSRLTPRSLLVWLRGFEKRYVGTNWRDGLVAIREHTPNIWNGWTERQRGQFIRHLRPYWDTHRHRCAPYIHNCILLAIKQGQLTVERARFENVNVGEDEVEVALRTQFDRSINSRVERFDAVINCTGPTLSVDDGVCPFIDSLKLQGMVQQDPLRLGLLVTDQYEIKEGSGIYYIGPMLRAKYWEATAVPELRDHACKLSKLLIP